MPNIKRAYRDLPIQTVAEFATVTAVKAALRRFEQGQFRGAAHLVDAMGRDDRLRAVLRTRIQGLLGCAVSFEPRGDKRRGKRAVKDVEKWFWDAYPESSLARLLGWGLMLNAGVGELVWTKTARRWEQTLKVWHPSFLSYRWDTRTYWLNTQDGQIELTPGDGKWILFTPHGRDGGAWMDGLVRSIALPWLTRQYAYRDWGRWSERHGSGGPIKAKVPAEFDEAKRKQFVSDLMGLAQEGLLVVTQNKEGIGEDVEILEPKAVTWEGIEKLLAKTDTSLAVAVLGQNLTTEVQGGSRAASVTHDKVRQDLKEFDAQSLATCLQGQGLAPWARYNLGDPHLAPYPCWQTDPPEDRKAQGEALEKLGHGITALRDAGVPVDGIKLAEERGIPLAKEEAPPKPGPGEEGEEDEGDGDEELSVGRVQLASGAKAPRGMVEGQAYADDLADIARDAGAKAIAPDVEAVLAAIEGAESFDALKAELVKLYAAMAPDELAAVAEGAEGLAFLAGRRSQRRDLR